MNEVIKRNEEGKPIAGRYDWKPVSKELLESAARIVSDVYYDMIREKINVHGAIEGGELDWEDVTRLSVIMDELGLNADIPDDIVGEFAERGYGEVYPNGKKSAE